MAVIISFRLASGAAVVATAAANPANTVNKVVELLGALQKQLKDDAAVDNKQFNEYKAWYLKEDGELKRVITETQDLLKASDEDLKQQEAFVVSKRGKLDKAAAAMSKAEKELADAKEVREAESKAFKKNEAELVEAVDQFERALEVMARKQPAAAAFLEAGAPELAAPKGAGLLRVAQQLRRTLEGSADLALTESQRDVLGSFVRLAARSAKEEAAAQPKDVTPALSLDFLQVRSQRAGAKGSGGDNDDSGVVETLQTVLQKTTERLGEIRQQESDAQKAHVPFVEGLKQEIQSQDQTMQTLKMEISQHQQRSGELKSVLLAGQEKLKVTQDNAAELQGEFERKQKSFQQRSQKRADEELAVKEAHQILTSGDAQKVFKAESFVEEAEALPAFVQLKRVVSHRNLGRSSDPFGKVKKMISAMLHKLQEDQSDEQKHASWCDKELTKTKASQKLRARDVEKVADRMEEMEAELEQVKNDLDTIGSEVKELNEASTKAQAIRGEESKRAQAAMGQYSQGVKLITTAITVLKEYYAKQDEAADKEHGYEANGAGSQVIGILEVAQEDYSELLADQQRSEIAAQKDFNNFMNDFQVRMAVFTKDLEYKQRAQTKLNSERMRASEDLKNYEKELEAVLSYLKQLEASCTIKGDSYEERQGKRQQELASLKEALAYLRGEQS